VDYTEKYLKQREKEFKENYPDEEGMLANIKSWVAEMFSGALGHGAAVTFPDRPYLKRKRFQENQRSFNLSFLPGSCRLSYIRPANITPLKRAYHHLVGRCTR